MEMSSSAEPMSLLSLDESETSTVNGSGGGGGGWRNAAAGVRLGLLGRRLWFVVLGCTTFVAGLLAVICGFVGMFASPSMQGRHGFRMESKWHAVLCLLAGAVSLSVAARPTAVKLSALLCLASASAAVAVCMVAVYAANFYFGHKDVQYYQDDYHNASHMAEIGRSINVMHAVLIADGLLIVLSSILLTRQTLYVLGKHFGFSVTLDRRRYRLAIAGLIQILLGLTIAGGWAAVETLFVGENANFGETYASHGLIVVVLGYLQMLASSKSTRPLILAAAVFNGVGVVLCAFYCERPMSLFAFALDHSNSFAGGPANLRMAMCLCLAGVYVTVAVLGAYSLTLLSLAQEHDAGPVSQFAEHIRLSIWSYCQGAMSLAYAVVDVAAIGMFVLYKLDFTPLPLAVALSALMAFASKQTGSLRCLACTAVACGFCVVYAFRDIYLFIYHVSNARAPDNPTRARMSGLRLGVHFCILALALGQLASATYAALRLAKLMVAGLSVAERSVGSRPVWLRTVAFCQLGLATGLVSIGARLFLTQSYVLETFGDISIGKGLLLMLNALLLLVGLRERALLPVAALAQLLCLVLLAGQFDMLAGLIETRHKMLRFNPDADLNGVYLATVNFVAFLLQLFLTTAASVSLGELLYSANIRWRYYNAKPMKVFEANYL